MSYLSPSNLWHNNSPDAIRLSLPYEIITVAVSYGRDSKAPFIQGCDLRATFERPGKWLGRSVVAKTQKVLFLCNCCSTILVVAWATKAAVVAQQVAQRRQSGGRTSAKVAEGMPWSPNGGTVVATVIAQWTLLVWQRRHKGGTRKAEVSLKLIHNVHNSTIFFTGRPMADHCASILRPRQCLCLPPASFEWPVSERPPRRPLCDCFEHAQNLTATMASMAMSERPVYHPWTTKATSRPPLCLQRWHGQFCGRTREAQWSHIRVR